MGTAATLEGRPKSYVSSPMAEKVPGAIPCYIAREFR
jgi:hypothetical protein